MYSFPYGIKDATGVVHGKFDVREMNGYDEEILISGKAKNVARTTTKLIAGCVTVIEGVEKVTEEHIRQLLVGDRNYALLAIRVASLGKDYEFNVECPHCKAENQVSQDLMELKINRYEGDTEFDLVMDNEITLPDGSKEKTVRCRFLTGKDQEEIFANAGNEAQSYNLALVKTVVSIGSFKLITQDFMKGLPKRVRDEIMMTVNKMTPGVDLDVEVVCGGCSKKFKAQADLNNFFVSQTTR